MNIGNMYPGSVFAKTILPENKNYESESLKYEINIPNWLLEIIENYEVSNKKNDSKQENTEVKDCFETVNRGIFAFNQGLDKIFFKIQKSFQFFIFFRNYGVLYRPFNF